MALADTATGIVRELLRNSYGLDFDEFDVNRWVGLLSDDPDNFAIVDQEIRDSDVFKARFPGMSQRLDNGYNALSVDEYLALEDQYLQVVRVAGLPAHFYDSPEELGELIANNVNPTEFETRVVDGFIAAREAPQEVKDMLSEFYGIADSEGALAAYYLDPDKALPAIQKEFESAVIGARARTTGFAAISRDQAQRLQSLGITADQAAAGFTSLGMQKELHGQNLGTGQQFSISDLLKAEFEGDTSVLEAIRRQREQRLSDFSGSSGGSLVGRTGVAGAQGAST